MPSIILIAGPNGAGKTTFGDEYLSVEERDFEFVNADEIARGLDLRGVSSPSDVLAARMMLRRVDELVEAGANFVVETTLATLTYAGRSRVGEKVATLFPWCICAFVQLRSRWRSFVNAWPQEGTISGTHDPSAIWKEPQILRDHLQADRRRVVYMGEPRGHLCAR